MHYICTYVHVDGFGGWLGGGFVTASVVLFITLKGYPLSMKWLLLDLNTGTGILGVQLL